MHFASGKSYPCTGLVCPLCSKGYSTRYYAYYPIEGKNVGPGLLELTGIVEANLSSQLPPGMDVVNGIVDLHKPAGAKNQSLQITFEHGSERAGRFDPVLTPGEIESALLRIWNLPSRSTCNDETMYMETLANLITERTAV